MVVVVNNINTINTFFIVSPLICCINHMINTVKYYLLLVYFDYPSWFIALSIKYAAVATITTRVSPVSTALKMPENNVVAADTVNMLVILFPYVFVCLYNTIIHH